MVPEGGDFIFAQALSPRSPIARPPSGAFDMLRVNSFDVKYRDDGSVDQFVSDLSVLDGQGRELMRKSISVNDPLRYQVLCGCACFACLFAVVSDQKHPASSLSGQCQSLICIMFDKWWRDIEVALSQRKCLQPSWYQDCPSKVLDGIAGRSWANHIGWGCSSRSWAGLVSMLDGGIFDALRRA